VRRYAQLPLRRDVNGSGRALPALAGPAEETADHFLRFGVLVDGGTRRTWEDLLVRRLVDSGLASLSAILTSDGSKVHPARGRWRGRLQSIVWDLYIRLWMDRRSRALRSLPSDVLSDSIEPISDQDLLRIRRLDLDFILNLSSGRPNPALADLARHGMWSFQVGRSRGPAVPLSFFWEVSRRDPAFRIALLRRTGRPGAGGILREGYFRTHDWSCVRNLDAVLLGAVDWPVDVCRRLRYGADLPEPAAPPSVLVSRTPTNLQMIGAGFKAVVRLVALHSRAIIYGDQWNVGIVEAPISDFLTDRVPHIHWFPTLRRPRFLADPFGAHRDGKLTVLMEEWDARRSGSSRRGRIVAVNWAGNGGITEPRLAMDHPFHTSYPFLVEHEGHMFCIPETAAAERIDLYRATSFPVEWVKVGSLVEGFAVTDPTVFRHEGRWWLLGSGHRLASDDLYCWFAEELTGPWSPHPGNPLKTDVRSTRPAGTPFLHDGQLYRPAQDNSRSYGGSTVLNRILKLTPTTFEEEAVRVITPSKYGPYPDGLHTLSSVGGLTLVDGKRNLFVWQSFLDALGSRVRRVWGGNPGTSGLHPATTPSGERAERSS
jgi:hypothetical protein